MKKFINRRPANAARWALGMLPFVLLLIIYMLASDARLAENPNDKLLPALDNLCRPSSGWRLSPVSAPVTT